MKKILITGVKGFICSNLTNYLVKKYPNDLFVGIDSNSYCASDDNIKDFIKETNFIYMDLDLTDFNKTKYIFSIFNFTHIYHFAAYSFVDRSFENPSEVYHNNSLATFNVIECSRNFGVSKFIQMSTDEVYGDKYTVADEKSVLNPTNPYSGSKASADLMIISYINGYKFPAIIIRCNNIYGIKQYPEKVIPKFILSILSGTQCTIHGDGKQVRTFIHVDDFCSAFDIITEKGIIGEIYNIGSQDELSINQLFNLINDKIVEKYKIKTINPKMIQGRQYNDRHYTIKYNKLIEMGWKQEKKIENDIGNIIEWYNNKYTKSN